MSIRGQLSVTVQGNTNTNLLGSDGDCESVSGWLDNSAAASLDTNDKVFSLGSIKATLGLASGTVYRTVPANLMFAGKYYMISAYIKNGNATSARLYIDGILPELASLSVTNTSGFTRVMVKIPNTTTIVTPNIHLQVYGTAGQYAFIDGIMANEISASEYVLSDVELFAKYNFINGTKSTLSIGKTLRIVNL